LKVFVKYPVVIFTPAMKCSSRSYDALGRSFGIMHLGPKRTKVFIDVELTSQAYTYTHLDSYLSLRIITNLDYWVKIEVFAKSRDIPILQLLRELRFMKVIEIENLLNPVRVFRTNEHVIGYLSEQ
jgi:hypothetical protein